MKHRANLTKVLKNLTKIEKIIIIALAVIIVVGIIIMIYSFVACLNAPIIIFLVALFKMKRDNKKYNEYLKYCPENVEPNIE